MLQLVPQPHQLQRQGLPLVLRRQLVHQVYAAEGGFIHDLSLPQRCRNGRVQLPAVGALDAVLHRQLLPLLGVQVVRRVGVPGGDDVVGGVGLHLLHHLVHDGCRLRGAQGAVDEVVLHVNDQ